MHILSFSLNPKQLVTLKNMNGNMNGTRQYEIFDLDFVINI